MEVTTPEAMLMEIAVTKSAVELMQAIRWTSTDNLQSTIAHAEVLMNLAKSEVAARDEDTSD